MGTKNQIFSPHKIFKLQYSMTPLLIFITQPKKGSRNLFPSSFIQSWHIWSADVYRNIINCQYLYLTKFHITLIWKEKWCDGFIQIFFFYHFTPSKLIKPLRQKTMLTSQKLRSTQHNCSLNNSWALWVEQASVIGVCYLPCVLRNE